MISFFMTLLFKTLILIFETCWSPGIRTPLATRYFNFILCY
nr:MAG TPA_asm: hypothetical protein [Caudoviricetes sp.]